MRTIGLIFKCFLALIGLCVALVCALFVAEVLIHGDSLTKYWIVGFVLFGGPVGYLVIRGIRTKSKNRSQRNSDSLIFNSLAKIGEFTVDILLLGLFSGSSSSGSSSGGGSFGGFGGGSFGGGGASGSW